MSAGVAVSNRISSLVLFIVLAGAPFPFGSRDLRVIAFWCGFLGFGIIFASLRHLRVPHVFVLGAIALVAGAFAFVLHEQLSGHPWIAPYHPIWAKAGKLLKLPVLPSASLVRNEPFYALGPSLAAGLALVLGVIVGANRQHARTALRVIAWSGAAYAVYGITSLIFEPRIILWREKTAYVGDLTGTFINRNTAASYFGSCAAIWLILTIERMSDKIPRIEIIEKRLLRDLLTVSSDRLKDIAPPFVMLFLCLTALLLTRSRAGTVVSLSMMVLTAVLYFYRHLPSHKGMALAATGGIAMALLVLQVLGGRVSQRFELQGLEDEGRLAAWRSTLQIIGDHPWFGTGLGTFPAAFPAYRSNDVSMWGVWDRAHSTPLELAAEVGIPLALLIGTGWVVIIITMWRGVMVRRRDRSIPLAALSTSLIALLHSCVDFSLQIVSYSLVVFGLAGIGIAQSFRYSDPPQD